MIQDSIHYIKTKVLYQCEVSDVVLVSFIVSSDNT